MLVIRTYRVAPDASEKKNYLAELAEGLRYTLDHPTIRKVIVVAGVSTFFGRGILEIMPAFAALIFDGGSAELAVLMAAAGAGANQSGRTGDHDAGGGSRGGARPARNAEGSRQAALAHF